MGYSIKKGAGFYPAGPKLKSGLAQDLKNDRAAIDQQGCFDRLVDNPAQRAEIRAHGLSPSNLAAGTFQGRRKPQCISPRRYSKTENKEQ
jgi:hypothetical protein